MVLIFWATMYSSNKYQIYRRLFATPAVVF